MYLYNLTDRLFVALRCIYSYYHFNYICTIRANQFTVDLYHFSNAQIFPPIYFKRKFRQIQSFLIHRTRIEFQPKTIAIFTEATNRISFRFLAPKIYLRHTLNKCSGWLNQIIIS